MTSSREELLFHLALTKPEDERGAWLDRECGDDPTLRARLGVLLAAHARSETLLAGEPEAALRADASTRPPVPTLRLDLTDAPGEAIGFEAERQALAMMDHPNIAKVLDAGTIGASDSQLPTPNSQLPPGRPYFVMELVRGIKITDYCDQANLSTKERLDLQPTTL